MLAGRRWPGRDQCVLPVLMAVAGVGGQESGEPGGTLSRSGSSGEDGGGVSAVRRDSTEQPGPASVSHSSGTQRRPDPSAPSPFWAPLARASLRHREPPPHSGVGTPAASQADTLAHAVTLPRGADVGGPRQAPTPATPLHTSLQDLCQPQPGAGERSLLWLGHGLHSGW